MQNEPNLPKAQMNVNKVLTKDYENISNWILGENEAKTNPNEPNSSRRSLWRSRNKANFREKNAALGLYAVGYLKKK